MIEVRKATQEDIDFVRLNPVEEVVKEYPKLELGGVALTALVDGNVVGVGGIVIFWEGVAEGWFILSKQILNFKIEMVLCIRKVMEQLISEHKIRRLQVTVRTDFLKAKELVETLGFKYEGTMEKYSLDGTDCMMYVRII